MWANGQQDSFRAGLIKKDELVSTREGLTKLLSAHGIEEAIAFKLVEKIRKGKTLLQEEIDTIKNSGIRNEILKNILKIKYLFPEAIGNRTLCLQIEQQIKGNLNEIQNLYYKKFNRKK